MPNCTYLHPGLFNTFTTCLVVSAKTLVRVLSNLSDTDNNGTLSTSEIAKCSFDIPMRPAALAPTIRKT
jgi:hypothetical protein